MDRLYRTEDGYIVERDGAWHHATGDVFGAYGLGRPVAGAVGSAKWLAPVTPSKIVCVGFNYKDHATETGQPLPTEPLLFLKPSSAVIGPGDPIRLPPGVGRVDHEAEIGVVIGRRAHRVPRARAWDYILGLTCVNDVTARALQTRESQFTRCKGFDTFAPIGPCIVSADEIGDPQKLRLQTRINGELRQSGTTANMIWSCAELIHFFSINLTLKPGMVTVELLNV